MAMKAQAKRMLRCVVGEPLYRELHARRWADRLRRGEGDALAPFIAQFVKTGDVCLDIGAHGGSVTVPLSRAVGPEGHVFAFEARPDYAATLERTLALLGISNVTVLAVAVGERDAQARLVVEAKGSDLTGRSHLAASEPDQVSVPVTSRRLDGLAGEIPRLSEATLVKIDVEGAELFVLRGGSDYFGTVRPAVYCEVQDEHCARYGHAAATVFEAFEALGFDGERVSYADVVFTPRERTNADRA